MSWISSIISAPQEREDATTQQLQARQRAAAATRAKLVKNLRNAAQGLAALEATQQSAKRHAEGRGGGGRGGLGAGKAGSAATLIRGDTAEAQAVCAALEQCLFHRIRVKEFGVIPFWAFLERVERLPITTASGSRPGPRERGLSSVRNTVGAVASLGNATTPLGRSRAWIRQCLGCKCLEACVAAMLQEDRLVKVFYEPTALARCREGSTILLRLCAALEAFDIAIDTDQSELNSRPRWPIIDEEAERDRRAEDAAAAAAAHAHASRTGSIGQQHGPALSGGGSGGGWGGGGGAPQEEESWFQQQRRRQEQQQREEGRGRPETAGGWAASAMSEFDELAQGLPLDKLDGVLATVTSKVDQAVQSLDETIHEIFGDQTEAGDGQHLHLADPSLGSSKTSNAAASRRVLKDGWVELHGGVPSQSPTLLDASQDASGRRSRKGSGAIDVDDGLGMPGGAMGRSAPSAGGGEASYPGSFVKGSTRRGKQGKGRVFGVPLEELVLNPERCSRGVLDPALGVPDAVLSLIEALRDTSGHNTAGMFVEDASEAELFKAIKSLEKTNSVPTSASSSSSSSSSPAWLVSRLTGAGDGGGGAGGGGEKGRIEYSHTFASALLFFLHRLPEPLLTFRRRDAFLSCETIPDLDARVRNVKLLVDDLPWAHKPLLIALVDLVASTAPPTSYYDHGDVPLSLSDMSGVTVTDEAEAIFAGRGGGSGGGGVVALRNAAESLAPALLRPPPVAGRGGAEGIAAGGASSGRPDWEEELAAAAVLELILSEQDRVLEGMRAEQRSREERLSGKVKRLGQLRRMLATDVFLERSSHMALVMSLWHRLEKVEHEILQEAALESEQALGLGPFTTPGGGREADFSGLLLDERVGKTSSCSGDMIAFTAESRGDGTAQRVGTVAPAIPVDEDRDVRELESMFLGLEEGLWVGEENPDRDLSAERTGGGGDGGTEAVDGTVDNEVPLGRSTATVLSDVSLGFEEVEGDGILGGGDAVAGLSRAAGGTARSGSVLDSEGKAVACGRNAPSMGEAAAEVAEKEARSGETVRGASDHGAARTNSLFEDRIHPLAFTIEEDGDDDCKDAGSPGSPTSRVHRPESYSVDREGTLELLDSIADTLTPSAPAQNGDTDAGPLLVTRSELALVNLMAEAGEESGGLSGLEGSRSPEDESPPGDKGHSAGGVSGSDGRHGPRRGVQRGHSGFDDALMAGSSPSCGISDLPARVVKAPGAGEERRAAALNGAVDTAGGSRSSVAARPLPAPVFSLGHKRWVTCGFTVGSAVGKGGQEACVRRALRGASSVLALDSMNYFLRRYPRSAARAVKACARRHALSRGGVNSCPFPIYAGDLTHVISDLLSLPPPPPASTPAGREAGNSATDGGTAVPGRRDIGGAESMDLCALRLAALPTWPLLDAPNAFQEAFAMAVLIMEVGLAAGTRDHNPLRYQESLLETRRVVHSCILHAPNTIDALWAAAAVEGGVFPDPEDTKAPSPAIDGKTIDQTGHEAAAVTEAVLEGDGLSQNTLSEQFVQVLGVSELDLRDEDLAALGVGGVGDGGAASKAMLSAIGASADDRFMFGDGTKPGGSIGGGIPRSDWLMAGETARAGVIDNIAAENAGRSGPIVVNEGGFRTRLLCPSQIVTAESARALAVSLPDNVSSNDWLCLFSDARHGSSLNTLLARCAGWEPTLVVIRASQVSPGAAEEASFGAALGDAMCGGVAGKAGGNTTVFGGFASGGQWKNAGRGFSGDGQSFLFSFDGRGGGGTSTDEAKVARILTKGDGDHLNVYRWRGSDRSFMTSQDGIGLGMGGGGNEGNFGFFLESDLRRGTTGRCETFGNDPLVGDVLDGSQALPEGAANAPAATGGVFEVVSIEVWGFRASNGIGLGRVEL